MLFSRKDVSDLVNTGFEAAWQSVRPAALVRIDFGNGRTITRTLNGNIATYICTADGLVVDVIPGVYDPATYTQRLKQALLLHDWALRGTGRRPSREPRSREAIVAFLKQYHAEQAAAIRKHKEPKLIVESRRTSIVGIERNMKLVLRSSLKGASAGRVADSVARKPRSTPYTLPKELSSRVGALRPEMVARDSRYNESVRRLMVHDYLARHAGTSPAEMTKPLYRDVLNTDLDDPYLGLGKVLFGAYPFGDGK